jgi:hypothetical protein
MTRNVELRWGKPCRWDLATGLPPQESDNGIYQITRVWGVEESLLYIGIVWADRRDFYTRMNEHRKQWLGQFRGVNYRFAHVVPLRGLVRDRQLVEEIEGALINQLLPPYNDKKTVTYSLRRDLCIVSQGYRGEAPKRLNTGEHEWVGEPGGRARAVRR